MPRPPLALLVAGLLAGCGADDAPLPVSCTHAATIVRALAAAPGVVTLPDGAHVSDCVARATGDAELQEFGFAATSAAERLESASRDDEAAALRLGYLIGAARNGAARVSNGIPAELVHRLERSGAQVVAPADDDLVRGMRAGEARG